jgi:hypothetical protein
VRQFQHPAVRDLGFALMQAQHHVSTALDIFIHNYQSGDDRFLAGLVAQAQDNEVLHHLGNGLSHVFAIHPQAAMNDVFLDLYERGPCSLCRERFVERLREIDGIPA